MPAASGSMWISPEGESHPVESHAPFAYDVLVNSAIGDAESKALELTPYGDSLEWKGTGGAEAKSEAQEQYSGRSKDDPQNSADLRNLGWVQVRVQGNQVFVFASQPESIARAWNIIGGLMAQYGGISFGLGDSASHSSTFVSGQEVGDSADGDAILSILRSRMTSNKSGLGMWLRR